MTPRLLTCTDCGVSAGGQHKPSCHRQGLVTATSDYTHTLAAVMERKTAELEAAGLCRWEYRCLDS